MNDILNQEIKDRLNKLPPKISGVINSFPWIEKVNEISKDTNLSENQKNSFLTETAILILGIESPQNFPKNIIERVGVKEDQAKIILDRVDKEIVTPILAQVASAPELSISSEPEPARVVEDENLQKNIDSSPSKVLPKDKFASVPNYAHYEPGQDPYHEPLE
jgi:hypothetical protein